MSKIEIILELIKKSNYKSLYLANLDKKYLDNNNKNIKMPDVKYIIFLSHLFINKYTIST